MPTTLVVLGSIAGTLFIIAQLWLLYINNRSSIIHREVIVMLGAIGPILDHLAMQQEESLAKEEEDNSPMGLKGN